MSLGLSQISLKTMLLAVVAVAANIAPAPLLLATPVVRGATSFVVGLFALGILMPALWVGTLRRLGYDALLIHIALVGFLVLVFVSASLAGAMAPVLWAYTLAAVGVPSVAWYVARLTEDGEAQARANRFAMASTKGAAQLAFGFAFWCLTLIAILMCTR